jgi:hypothetical protein
MLDVDRLPVLVLHPGDSERGNLVRIWHALERQCPSLARSEGRMNHFIFLP